jgi:SPX domain protein involved in polyphosphate accumulation
MELANPNYNEYKFYVTDDNLGYVRNVLDSLYGGSDPFATGVVDSIYFDTMDSRFYEQCLNGEVHKRKFRIRAYGDSWFRQMHVKDKDLFTVIKRKQAIRPIRFLDYETPEWYQLEPAGAQQESFAEIRALSEQYGVLRPVIRVRYQRQRYRIYDYRMTLDTNIEVMGFSNFCDLRHHYAVLPHHVLEIKTVDPRPHLPLLGLSRLPQISFSKFFLGLNLLHTGEISGY